MKTPMWWSWTPTGGVLCLTERRAVEPVLPLSLFQNRTVAVSLLVVFTVGIAMFGVISFIPLFVQGSLGASATSSGAIMVPMMITMVSCPTAISMRAVSIFLQMSRQ